MHQLKNSTWTHTPFALSLALALGLSVTSCKKAEAKVKGVGDTMKAFIIKNCSTGERYCQVCAYSGKPTIMAVGDIEDAAFQKDLAQIQKLVASNGEKGLTAFALYGKFKGDTFTPVEDEAAAEKKLAALAKELGVTFPVTLVPKTLTKKESSSYPAFAAAYDIKKSRTLMLAGANNEILFSETLGADTKAQFEALSKAVAGL